MERTRAWIVDRTAAKLDPSRLLVVIAARACSEALLAGSLSGLTRSATRCGLGVDVILGLDHGFAAAPFQRDISGIVRSPVVAETLAVRRPGESFGADGLPSSLTSRVPVTTHRIWMVSASPERPRGKIRLLREIYGGIVLPAIASGWQPPSRLLTLDAESRIFLARDGDSGPSRAEALRTLLAPLDAGFDLVGSHMRMSWYRRSGAGHVPHDVPDLKASVPPAFKAISTFHGWFPGFQWLPGGGTAGRLEALVSLLSTVADTYPACRVEDVHATVLARAAGLRIAFASGVVSSNLCEPATGAGTTEPQLRRWLAGICGLESLYGRAAVRDVVGGRGTGGLLLSIPSIVRQLRRPDVLWDVGSLVATGAIGPARRHIREERAAAARSPDRPESASAAADW